MPTFSGRVVTRKDIEIQLLLLSTDELKELLIGQYVRAPMQLPEANELTYYLARIVAVNPCLEYPHLQRRGAQSGNRYIPISHNFDVEFKVPGCPTRLITTRILLSSISNKPPTASEYQPYCDNTTQEVRYSPTLFREQRTPTQDGNNTDSARFDL